MTFRSSATHEALKGHGRCACTSAERCGVPCPGTMERTRQWSFHTHPEYVAYIYSINYFQPFSFSYFTFVFHHTLRDILGHTKTTRSQPLLPTPKKKNFHPQIQLQLLDTVFPQDFAESGHVHRLLLQDPKELLKFIFWRVSLLGKIVGPETFLWKNMGSCPQSSAISF